MEARDTTTETDLVLLSTRFFCFFAAGPGGSLSSAAGSSAHGKN